MDKSELRDNLIRACQEKRFDDLMTLIEDHQPDFTDDYLKFKFKGIVTNSVGNMLSAYIAYFRSSSDMQKILDLGCCPNKYSVESRPLINAIKQEKFDMVKTLVNYICHCSACNGSGVKITNNAIKLSSSNKDINSFLIQKINGNVE